VSLPTPSTSILSTKAYELGLPVSPAKEEDKLRLYLATLETMCDSLYSQDHNRITKKFIDDLRTDLQLIIIGLRRVKSKAKAKEYIEEAYVELGVAAQLSRNKEGDPEESDATTRIRNRLKALNSCKNFLDNAVLQW